MTRPYWAGPPREVDLSIELARGGTIALRGADNYDGLRGDGLDFLVLDEYATMAPEAWNQVLRPALADRRGRALFIGCLLYTSDAADDLLCVDLGGRRIIKKK